MQSINLPSFLYTNHSSFNYTNLFFLLYQSPDFFYTYHFRFFRFLFLLISSCSVYHNRVVAASNIVFLSFLVPLLSLDLYIYRFCTWLSSFSDNHCALRRSFVFCFFLSFSIRVFLSLFFFFFSLFFSERSWSTVIISAINYHPWRFLIIRY